MYAQYNTYAQSEPTLYTEIASQRQDYTILTNQNHNHLGAISNDAIIEVEDEAQVERQRVGPRKWKFNVRLIWLFIGLCAAVGIVYGVIELVKHFPDQVKEGARSMYLRDHEKIENALADGSGQLLARLKKLNKHLIKYFSEN